LKGDGMNTQNYASLEACKRLADSGIVLETDFYWYLPHKPTMCGKTTWFIERKYYLLVYTEMFPAPSIAEVLKELPNNTAFLKNKIYYASTGGKDNVYKEFISTNPTDALIDLLIWTRKEKV